MGGRFVQKMRSLFKCMLYVPVVLCVIYFGSPSLSLPGLARFFVNLIPMDRCSLESAQALVLDNNVDAGLDLMSRSDVQTCTYWRAPIIWEGMFDPAQYDRMHQLQGSSVALTVFAVGRYLEAYLPAFLNSSEQHFMLGLPVTYYVFTDRPDKVPALSLGPRRRLKVVPVEKRSRWQDISMMRMKSISDAIESEIGRSFTHVFCLDVDQVFSGRFGSEALGDSVALLHAYYYRLPKRFFTYDRNARSRAFMATGDFYYHAAVFGGRCDKVKAAADACYRGIVEDKDNRVEALWHDESHLNKYFWLNKPSRVLSPEYCWDPVIGQNADIRVARLVWAPKKYDDLRAPERPRPPAD